jgi:hypothetical protein
LHAPQPPLHAVSQQAPFTQNPVGHWLFDVHDRAKDASYKLAVAFVVDPVAPPAMRTMLFESNVAVWFWTALAMAVVALQVLVPFHSSAEASVVDPLDPPTTSTEPFLTMVDGSSVAVWSCLAAVIVPAEAQLPEPDAAVNSCVVLSVVVPDRPPTTRTFPVLSAVAV